MRLRFDFPMPDSWSRKRKLEMLGQPHQQKPDIDNCIKAIMDPLLKQDCTVWHIAGAEKRWALAGSITIEVSAA
jgi:Holliday junction resolvase RusA-like endonuclease